MIEDNTSMPRRVFDYRNRTVGGRAAICLSTCLIGIVFSLVLRAQGDPTPFVLAPLAISLVAFFVGLGHLSLYLNERLTIDGETLEWQDRLGRRIVRAPFAEAFIKDPHGVAKMSYVATGRALTPQPVDRAYTILTPNGSIPFTSALTGADELVTMLRSRQGDGPTAPGGF